MQRVEEEAHKHNANRVHAIYLQVGQQSGVELELLETAFEMFKDGSLCRDANLSIEPVAAVWCCTACDRQVTPNEILRCRDCGAPARLTAGDEIILSRIEMERADSE